MKKILFPFFKDHHKFLSEKWWFRLIIVTYLIMLVVTPFIIFSNYLDYNYGWCYKALPSLYNDNEAFNTELAKCSAFARGGWAPSIGVALIGTLIIHYIIQFIFFKVIIDFIVLGKSKVNNKLS